MKKLVLSIIALTTCSGAFAAPEKKADAAAGKGLFANKCASCHGKDAKGNPALAKMFKVDPERLNLLNPEVCKLTAAEQGKIVAEGKGTMKGFKDRLGQEDIANVTAFVRSLSAETPSK